MAPLVRTGGSRHTGLAALPHRNIHSGGTITPQDLGTPTANTQATTYLTEGTTPLHFELNTQNKNKK